MAWTAHWVKQKPGIPVSFSEEDGIYLHLYIQRRYVMLFCLDYVQKNIFWDIVLMYVSSKCIGTFVQQEHKVSVVPFQYFLRGLCI